MAKPQSSAVTTGPDPRGVRRAPRSRADELSAATERATAAVSAQAVLHRMDALVQQLFAEAGPLDAAGRASSRSAATDAASCACTRTSTCWCCLPVRSAPEDERFLHAFLNPLWDLGLTIGHHVREVHEGSAWPSGQSGIPARADRRAGRRRRCDAARSVHRRRPSSRRRTRGRSTRSRRSSSSGTRGSTTRCISSSRTSRKRLAACAICSARRRSPKLTDPALLGAGRLGSARARRRRGVPAARPLDPAPRGQAASQRPQPRAAGAGRRASRLPGRDAAPARRAVDGRLLPPRARDRSLAAVGAQGGARARSAVISCRAGDGIRFVDAREAAERPETWLAAFQAAIDGGCAVSDEALACIQQHAGRFAPEDFFPTPAHRDALLAFLKPRPGLYARLSEMHDCGSARSDAPRVQGDQLPRRARLLPQVHRRRAHAADDSQPRAADGAPRPSASAFARLLGELEAPELLVLALLYPRRRQVARRGPRRRERADGAADVRAPRARRSTRATSWSSWSSSTSEDVARGVPARHRGSGDRPPVCRARRRRRAPEDAVPDDAGRRRGRQPRDADAVEGRAALAAVRRHLQPPDALVRRRGHRPRPAGASR